MAGEAKTTDFMLGDATVMIGLQADLFNLNPSAHSIGLVKNFTLSSDAQYIELTQGVKNTIVDSQITSNSIKAAMEVYEATAKNLTYGLGLDGSGLVATGAGGVAHAEIAAGATTAVLTGDVAAQFASGDFIEIKTGEDVVHIAKLSGAPSVSTNTTLTFTGYATPTGVTFPAGSTVRKVNAVNAGSVTAQPYLSAKVVGKLANNKIVTILFPKLRIVKGFQMAFTSSQYGNMPFEFTPFAQVAGDVNYSKIPDPTAVAHIFQGVV